jgi:hypothetical protein
MIRIAKHFSFATVATIIFASTFLFVSSAKADTPTLSVAQITPVQTSAIADGTFVNGWKWIFNVTVPTNETVLNIKFSDLTSTTGNIPAGGNIEFYSPQSSNASDEAHAIILTSGGTYSNPINLISSNDLDATIDGIQIQITVEARVPSGSIGASYSTSYGIQTNPEPVVVVTPPPAPVPITHTITATGEDGFGTISPTGNVVVNDGVMVQ